MARSRVAIVIPAFNEASTIASIVNVGRDYGNPIVVNDCSTDLTAPIAEASGALVLNHTVNQGYDGALNSGFKEAARLKYDFIITLDADGQHDPSLLRTIIDLLEGGSPLVLGVRSSRARISEHIFSIYTRIRYGVLDPLCGMKGYNREVYDAVGYFDSYKSIGTELTLRAVSSNVRFSQVKFIVNDRFDAPRFGGLLAANLKIIRALLIWLTK